MWMVGSNKGLLMLLLLSTGPKARESYANTSLLDCEMIVILTIDERPSFQSLYFFAIGRPNQK